MTHPWHGTTVFVSRGMKMEAFDLLDAITKSGALPLSFLVAISGYEKDILYENLDIFDHLRHFWICTVM